MKNETTKRSPIYFLNEEQKTEGSKNLMQRGKGSPIYPLDAEQNATETKNLMQVENTSELPIQIVRKAIYRLDGIQKPIVNEISSNPAEMPIDSNGQQKSVEIMELTKKDVSCQTPIETEPKFGSYANCHLVVVADIHYIDREGNDDDAHENELTINVYLQQIPIKLLGSLTVSYHDISNVVKLVKNKFPITIFADDAVKKHLAENDIRQQLLGMSAIRCYKNAGWNWVDNGWKYLFGNYQGNILINAKSNLPFYAECDARQSAEIWKNTYEIYQDKDISRVLNLFAFSGVTFKLFELAGHPLRFLLFVTGKTGSLKTSISKVLYTQLTKDECRDQPRRIDLDTGTSFERALVDEGYDTITLFDDFAPPKTRWGKNTLADNFESIVRMVGDGSTKSRSNRKLENCRGGGVHGSVVVTGEIMGEGLSSNLRCLYCNIERDKVNLKALTWLQQYKFGVCTLIKHFSDFLSVNWSLVLECIRLQYPAFRQQIKDAGILSQDRSKERYVYFMVLSEIVKIFLKDYCHLDENSLRKYFDNMSNSILRVLSINEAMIEEYDPTKNFVCGFIKLMTTKTIKISQKKFHIDEINFWDGFEDEDFVYILEERLYPLVKEYLLNTWVPYYLSLRDTKVMLAQEGFIVTCPNGHGKITYNARINIEGSDKKIDFLKFYKHKLSALTQVQ